ncbi:GAF and ANTAR domain-containing protein [Mumia qirimensis]|uniref:GAF and ANTAR domain-containing protein n=1 Tax=Mumia qirimensis TaxID=3234852 RepID=UPI00351D1162
MTGHDEVVSQVVRELSSIRGLTSSIEKVTESARVLFGADYAGVTLIRGGGRLESEGATHDIVERLDAVQYDLREGPCVDAATDEGLVLTGDLGEDPRWPNWGPFAREHGVNSMMAADLHADDKRIGALNIFGTKIDQFDKNDVALLVTFSAHAAAALASAHTIESLTTALENRTVIGQAEGIIMERFGVDDVTAFAVLKRYSQHSNTRLHEVAAEIAATRQLPSS